MKTFLDCISIKDAKLLAQGPDEAQFHRLIDRMAEENRLVEPIEWLTQEGCKLIVRKEAQGLRITLYGYAHDSSDLYSAVRRISGK